MRKIVPNLRPELTRLPDSRLAAEAYRWCEEQQEFIMKHTVTGFWMAAVAIGFTSCSSPVPPLSAAAREPEIRVTPEVYAVDKAARDFPPGDDFSTPESAWATICRVNGESDSLKAWQRVSVSRLASQFAHAEMPPGPASHQVVEKYLDARILEVRVYNRAKAAVIFQVLESGKPLVMTRALELEKGRWLNVGEDLNGTLEGARQKADRIMGIK